MLTPPVLEGCSSNRDREESQKCYGFHTFSEPICHIRPTGPFRDNIRLFIEECAEFRGYRSKGMTVWRTSLVHENTGIEVPLYTIEEDVQNSAEPFCDHCRGAGWSHHYVSKRRYHFIIPADEDWNKPLEEDVLDVQSHLLHGMIHCNGFGHLLRINGIEGGSKNLCGREIMDLWDHICSNLRTCKIIIEDLSKKHSMELRLLHGIAYGQPWFGRWGYKFSHGSFGVKQDAYEAAIEFVSSIPLDQIINDFSFSRDMEQIIDRYRSESETDLFTIRDLFRFMLSLKPMTRPDRELARAAQPVLSTHKVSAETAQHIKKVGKGDSGKFLKFPAVRPRLVNRIPVRKVPVALKEKSLLNKHRKCGLSRQQMLRAALLFVNRLTKKHGYYLPKLKNRQPLGTSVANPVHALAPTKPGIDVYRDLSCLYTNVLLRYPESDIINLAVSAILDGKFFVKEWPMGEEADSILRYLCRLIPSPISLESDPIRIHSPFVYVELPLAATVGDLKMATQCAMRDTYCITDQLKITDISKMEQLADNELIHAQIKPGSEIWVCGHGLDLDTELKHEGGASTWKVRCRCGAQDDDGERMMSCELCGIWQHTHCWGIRDAAEVPPQFVCESCFTSLAPQRSQPPPTSKCARHSSSSAIYATPLIM